MGGNGSLLMLDFCEEQHNFYNLRTTINHVIKYRLCEAFFKITRIRSPSPSFFSGPAAIISASLAVFSRISHLTTHPSTAFRQFRIKYAPFCRSSEDLLSTCFFLWPPYRFCSSFWQSSGFSWNPKKSQTHQYRTRWRYNRTWYANTRAPNWNGNWVQFVEYRVWAVQHQVRLYTFPWFDSSWECFIGCPSLL